MSKITAEVKAKDGGYYYPDFDIHVIAKDEVEAKKLVKKYHGIDVDKSTEELKQFNQAQEQLDTSEE